MDAFGLDHVSAARAELLIAQHTNSRTARFWLGLGCGACVMISLWVLWDTVTPPHHSSASLLLPSPQHAQKERDHKSASVSARRRSRARGKRGRQQSGARRDGALYLVHLYH